MSNPWTASFGELPYDDTERGPRPMPRPSRPCSLCSEPAVDARLVGEGFVFLCATHRPKAEWHVEQLISVRVNR